MGGYRGGVAARASRSARRSAGSRAGDRRALPDGRDVRRVVRGGRPARFHTDGAGCSAGSTGWSMRSTWREYRICPMSEIGLGEHGTRTVSWPIQLPELQALPCWPQIRGELDALPAQPSGDEPRTVVHFADGPHALPAIHPTATPVNSGAATPKSSSASVAPRRIDLRRDGYRPLHRDRWQFFPTQGPTGVMNRALERAVVPCGAHAAAATLGDIDWDGCVVHRRTRRVPRRAAGCAGAAVARDQAAKRVLPGDRVGDVDSGARREAAVAGRAVHPDDREQARHPAAARRNHRLLQRPGAPARHYPVPTTDGKGAAQNEHLQALVRQVLDRPVTFAGQLAAYRYIDMDEAARSGWEAARELLDVCGERWRTPPVPGRPRRYAVTAPPAPRSGRHAPRRS